MMMINNLLSSIERIQDLIDETDCVDGDELITYHVCSIPPEMPFWDASTVPKR
jgi:hypothetical protein